MDKDKKHKYGWWIFAGIFVVLLIISGVTKANNNNNRNSLTTPSPTYYDYYSILRTPISTMNIKTPFDIPTQSATPSVYNKQVTPTENNKQNAIPVENDKQTVTVYITDTGSKYHREGCQYLKKSCIAIDLDDAIAEGYTPCSKCHPPKG